MDEVRIGALKDVQTERVDSPYQNLRKWARGRVVLAPTPDTYWEDDFREKAGNTEISGGFGAHAEVAYNGGTFIDVLCPEGEWDTLLMKIAKVVDDANRGAAHRRCEAEKRERQAVEAAREREVEDKREQEALQDRGRKALGLP